MTGDANRDQCGDEPATLKEGPKLSTTSLCFRFSPRSPRGFTLVFPRKTFREIYKSTVHIPKLLTKREASNINIV